MIVKNEEKYLKECLESVKDVVDEIVIVDTGSTDKTAEIAQEYGAKILSFEWINDFSAARNFALKNSSGRWILYLDADERLSPNSRNELKKIVSSMRLEGVNCTVSSLDEKTHRPNVMRYVRLFRNSPNIRFDGCVHEQITDSLKNNKYKIVESGIEIIHLGYNISSDALKEKARRNLQLLLNEYSRNKSSYYAFQLGQTYSVLAEKENALGYFALAVKDEKLEKIYKAQSFRFLAANELERKNYSAAMELIRKALQNDSSSAIIYYVAAQISLAQNDFKQADIYCRKSLELNSSLKAAKRRSGFDILMDDKLLLYLGLNIALSNNMESYDFYFSRLRSSAEIDPDSIRLMNLLSLLKDKKELTPGEISQALPSLNDNSIDIVLNLISAYQGVQIKLSMLLELEDKFSEHPRFLSQLGQTYIAGGDFERAIVYLKKSLALPQKYPASVFSLAAAYIQLNRFDKIPELLEFAGMNFSEMPEVMQRISVLRQKLTPYLK
ncbi:MAG: glycosyltransferase [Methanosarcina sp.]